MNSEMKNAIRGLHTMQENGVLFPCPRCGLDRMKARIHTNALSRHEDVYICDQCGIDEALCDFVGHSRPLSEWALFVLQRVDAHFSKASVEDAWEEIQREQLDYLKLLYKRFRDNPTQPGFDSYRRAAFANCPGLELLMPWPFYARYGVAMGQLVVYFSSGEDGSIEVTPQLIVHRSMQSDGQRLSS